jgi:hypothetical protein
MPSDWNKLDWSDKSRHPATVVASPHRGQRAWSTITNPYKRAGGWHYAIGQVRPLSHRQSQYERD